MKNWTTVFAYEFNQLIRRKSYLFLTFGLPLIAVLIFLGYLVYTEITGDEGGDESSSGPIGILQGDELTEQDPVGYVDRTGAFDAPASESAFSGYVMQYETLEAGETALENEEIDVLYIIESDYFENGTVTHLARNFSITNLEQDIFDAFLLSHLTEGSSPFLQYRLRFPTANVIEKRIDRETEAVVVDETNEDQDFLVVYVFGLAFTMSVYISSGYLMQSVIDEKENKTVELVLTSVRPFPLLLGKTLAQGLVGLAQVVIWLGTLLVLSNQAATQFVDFSEMEVEPVVAVVAVVYFVLGFIFMAGIFASIGAMANTTREGSSLAGAVVLPSMIPLFFIVAFVEDPNGTLPTVLSMAPFTAPMAMVMRVAIAEVPIFEILISILITIVMGVLSIWMAARLFRVNTLLRGTMPKLREIPRLLFRA